MQGASGSPERQARRTVRVTLAAVQLTLLLAVGPASAQMANVPQIPAFLPMMTSVPASEPLPIDGTWSISTIGKRVRIEGGRAYAVDPWVHMFVLKVQPGMVVIKDVRAAGPGSFAGADLPLMGGWQASIGAGGVLDVTVASMIPVRYQLIPMQLDNPAWFEEERQRAAAPQQAPLPIVAPTPTPPPPVAGPDPIATPAPLPVTQPVQPAPGDGALTCRDVVYQAETDNYVCVR